MRGLGEKSAMKLRYLTKENVSVSFAKLISLVRPKTLHDKIKFKTPFTDSGKFAIFIS
jgi:hypothetical protein